MKRESLVFLTLTFLFACADNEQSEPKEETVESSEEISTEDIEQILNDSDLTDAEREDLEEQLTALREDCANGDEEACEELRLLMAELESEREDEEREDDEREDEEREDEEREDECEDGETLERDNVIYECIDGEWSVQC